MQLLQHQLRAGFTALLLSFLAMPMLGQIQYPIRTFPVGQGPKGTPQPVVTGFFQDQAGIIWMANYNAGLVSYDGADFRLHPEARARLGRVYCMEQDRWGRLWVGGDFGLITTSQPLSEYDPGELLTFTDSIGSVPLPKGKMDPYQRLAVDQNGNLWAPITTEKGSGFRVSFSARDEIQIDTLVRQDPMSHTVLCIKVSPQGDVWATSVNFDGDLLVWRGGNLAEVDTFKVSNPNPELIIQDQAFRCMTIDGEGNVWLGREDGWLYFLPQEDPTRVQAVDIGSRTQIKELLLLEDNQVLVGHGAGVTVVDATDLSVSHTLRIEQGLASNYVYSALRDEEKNLWIGTSNGVNWLVGDFAAFGHYTNEAKGEASAVLPEAGVNHLIHATWPVNEPGAPTYLFAGSGSGLVAIDREGRRRGQLFETQGLLSPIITSIHPDENLGGLWLGHTKGVSYLAPYDRPLSRSIGDPITVTWLGKPALLYNLGIGITFHINAISVRGEANQLQTVIALGGSGGFQFFYQGAILGLGEGHGLTGKGFMQLTLGPDDRLYVGSNDGNLFRMTQPLTLSFLDSVRNNTPPLEIPGFEFAHRVGPAPLFERVPLVVKGDTVQQIGGIVNKGPQKMWIITDKGLLSLKLGERDTLTLLLDRVLSAAPLTLDTEQNLVWATQLQRLLGLDPETGEIVKTVDRKDGLLSAQVWGPHALSLDSAGVFYWGTEKGITRYDPALDQPRPPLPDVRFTEVQASTYEEGYQEIRFDFTGLNYFWADEVQYRTRLLGYDEGWSEPTQEAKLRYTNLPAFLFPRPYTFEVNAGDLAGNWSEAVETYAFEVAPPWYFSWWFVLGSFLLLVGSIIWYLRSRFQAQQRRLEEEQALNQRLRQVDKLKDQFLANTSHELRTPLSGIIGITEALFDEADDDEQRRNLGMVVASGKRLASLVNDLLDFSRLKHADLDLHLKPVDLHSLVEIILQISYPLVQGKKLQLRNEIPRDLPAAHADEDRLAQVLHNLVGNAVKFTETGHIEVAARQVGDELEVSVQDTGIGIPAEKQEAIFHAFTQGDGSTQREYSGTGLGLSISQQLLQAHGGKIWVKSEEGQGATFYFTIPVSEGVAVQEKVLPMASATPRLDRPIPAFEAESSRPPRTLDQDQISILIVDDEPINHQVLKNHLKGDQFYLVSALNGQEALEVIDRGEHAFDLILLDVMMPRLSGYDVAKKIRQKYLPSDLPIIMVTAKNQVSDLVQGLETGANDYLTKPFTKDEFLARMHSHLNLRRINQATNRFVPNEFIRTLGHKTIMDIRRGDHVALELSVLFSDIRSYTTLSEGMTPAENFAFVNAYASRMGPVVKQHRGFINQYLGDGIMALFQRQPQDGLGAAVGMQEVLRKYNEQRVAEGRIPLRVGIGVHTGPLVMGIIGDRDRSDPAVIADTVNTASRLEGLTKYYRANILISETTHGGLSRPEQQACRYIGLAQVKGREAPLGIYECFAGDEEAQFSYKAAHKATFEQGVAAFLAGEMKKARATFASLDGQLDPVAAHLAERARYYEQEGLPTAWAGVEVMSSK